MTGPAVLIVGAGAVGTLLACDLLAQGVPARLIDHRPSLAASGPHSRAVMVWPRVLELLRKINLAEPLIAAGLPVPDVSFFSEGRHLGTVPMAKMDSVYPFALSIEQRKLEELLWRRFAELGGTVEVGVALESLEQSAQGPIARLRHAGGTTEEARPEWLVGADGAGSTVRRSLGIAYPGVSFPLGITLGDFPMSGARRSVVEYHYSAHGLLPLVHLPDGLCRLATVVLPGEPDWAERSLGEWQAMVDARTCRTYRLGQPLWTRTYQPRPGVAERFRDGRVLLVGDAAHSVVPLGGQGLNLGLQDALNLGWKLAGVLRGDLHTAILDGYDTERRQAVDHVRAVIRTEMSLSTASTARQRRKRNLTLRLAYRTGAMRFVAAPLMSQIGLTYAASQGPLWRIPLRRRARQGDRLPIFHGPTQTSGQPRLHASRHIAVAWPGRRRAARWRTSVAAAEAALAQHVVVYDLAALPARQRRRFNRLLGAEPVIALVRPDGHLAHLSSVDEPQRAAAFLTRLEAR